jgi:excisionase family DNA binding protein
MDRNKEGTQQVAVTIREAARRLSVSYITVWRMLNRGDLTRVRIGRSVRVLARSVDELAERGGVPRAQ